MAEKDNVIELDFNDKRTMNEQLKYYDEVVSSAKKEIEAVWIKIEAVELIVKGLRGML